VENGKTNNITDLYIRVNSLRKGYQPRLGLIRNVHGDLQADPTKILEIWKSYFDKLLNVHERRNLKNVDTEPSEIEVEISIKKLKIFESPGIDNIPAELIKAGGRALVKKLHKLISAVRRKQKLPKEWNISVIVPIYKKAINRTVIITAESLYTQHVTVLISC